MRVPIDNQPTGILRSRRTRQRRYRAEYDRGTSLGELAEVVDSLGSHEAGQYERPRLLKVAEELLRLVEVTGLAQSQVDGDQQERHVVRIAVFEDVALSDGTSDGECEVVDPGLQQVCPYVVRP